ncbi:AAA family ATPase [Candidatus Woesearchaeota archaeon]|nr:AAA family ATPase [Candidatus Woesearchaeota archaeon]
MTTNSNFGKIVFLNGTSSSGKSTLAKELEERLDGEYTRVSLDGFSKQVWEDHMFRRAKKKKDKIFEGRTQNQARDHIAPLFHDDVAKRALAGENLIVDHLFQEPEWFKDWTEKFADYDVTMVGLHCPLDVLKQMEIDRRDRMIGTAEYQFDKVHVNQQYDFEVDTSQLSSQDIAVLVSSYLKNKTSVNTKPTKRAKVKEWVKRYGLAEVIGTATAYAGFFLGQEITDNDIVAAYAGAMGENIGFYGTIITKEVIDDIKKAKSEERKYGVIGALKTAGKLLSEFGPAEILDSVILRPAGMGLCAKYLGREIGVFVGKIAADLGFYAVAISSYELRKRFTRNNS